MNLHRLLICCVALGMLGTPAPAGQVSFSGWSEQRFRLFSGVDFRQGGANLGIRSQDAASLIWTRLPQMAWRSTAADWQWAVTESVPGTDLARRGGDDRNAALYFVFLPQDKAIAQAEGGSLRALLAEESVRVLIYAWGGAHRRGDVLPQPHIGTRARTIVLRPAGTGSFAETVDLARDFTRAFGQPPETLVGLAISADSDDTDSTIAGRISGLTLR